MRLGFSHLPPRWRPPVIAMFTLAAFALLGQLLVYVHYAVTLFHFPFDYDQGEGFELYDTMLHARGEWPYRDSQVYPFYTSIYPPLFHLLTVPLVWVFGPELWTGRAVGFTASLIAATAVGLGVLWASKNRPVAAFSGLAFLASNYTFHIGPLFRQHMTMVMFETLAIVALAQAGNEQNPNRYRSAGLWVGMLCLLAAGYTKQLALATVLAGLAYLFLRGPRRALLAGVALAAVAGGLFLWINHATAGQWYLSVIRANINTFEVQQALTLYRQWAGLHLLIAAAALGRLIYETYFVRLSAYALWFVFSLANGALSGKFGAGESYFVTATAAACLLSGIGVARLWERSRRWNPRTAAALALAIPLFYLAQARLTLHMPTEGPLYSPMARLLGVAEWGESGYYDSQGFTQLGPHPTEADVRAGYAIAELARRAPGPVFSEEAGFMFVAGKPVVTNPFPQLVMHQAGLFDPAQEIAMINDKAFGLVILRGPLTPEPAVIGFYPVPVLDALADNYQLRTAIRMNDFLYRLLEPRP